MPTARPGRIVRRAVMVLAVVVLLPVGYVGGGISMLFARAAGWIPDPLVQQVLGPFFEPIGRYLEAGYPGSDAIEWAGQSAVEAGERFR